MKPTTCFSFALLAAFLVLAAGDTPTAPFEKQCSALGGLQIVNRGPGRCFGIVASECKVHAKAFSEINGQIEALIATGTSGCAVASLGARASAMGSALAEVFVDAYSKVTCTGGGGFACGFAVSEGFAWGQAYAESVALAFARALNVDSEALCTPFITSIANGIVSVLAHARAETCIIGAPGTAVAFGTSLSRAFTCVFSNAWATAKAIACSNSSASCVVEGGGSATAGCNLVSNNSQAGSSVIQPVPGSAVTATGTSTANGSAGFSPPCGTPVVACCFTTGSVTCPAPWVQLPLLGQHKTFRNTATGATCKCPF